VATTGKGKGSGKDYEEGKGQARKTRKTLDGCTPLGYNSAMCFIETPIFKKERAIQMKEQDFNNLIESVKQAGKIRRGKRGQARETNQSNLSRGVADSRDSFDASIIDSLNPFILFR
jgi:hypothetical protein